MTRCSTRSAAADRACRSLRRAAAIAAADRARFIYEALIKHLSKSLFCYHGKSLLIGGDWTGAWFTPPRA
jgi:hypothetical protein